MNVTQSMVEGAAQSLAWAYFRVGKPVELTLVVEGRNYILDSDRGQITSWANVSKREVFYALIDMRRAVEVLV